MRLSVREIQTSDIVSVADYWLSASSEYLQSMGADPDKNLWEVAFNPYLTLDDKGNVK